MSEVVNHDYLLNKILQKYMRTDTKVKRQLSEKEREFYETFGFVGNPSQLAKFKSPKPVKLYGENLAHKLAKSVPADRSVWRKNKHI